MSFSKTRGVTGTPGPPWLRPWYLGLFLPLGHPSKSPRFFGRDNALDCLDVVRGLRLNKYLYYILKLINNSTSYNKGNHNRDGGLEN